MDNTTSQYQMVREFMRLFNQSAPSVITTPPFEIRKLRAKLILEEAFETIEALGVIVSNTFPCLLRPNEFKFEDGEVYGIPKFNLVKAVDGLCDSHYVGYCGTGLALGIPESTLAECFKEVHRSNMSKMWSEEQLEEGKKKYIGCVVEHYGGGLYRLIHEGKVIKSPTYSEANLGAILGEYLSIQYHNLYNDGTDL